MQNDLFIPARGISMLVSIKHQLLADHDLCMEVSGCGRAVMASTIDNLIAKACAIESRYHDCHTQYKLEKEENDAYRDMLGDFTPDMLTDDEKAELHTLVEKWRRKDEEVYGAE